jgi:hypothetical protein
VSLLLSAMVVSESLFFASTVDQAYRLKYGRRSSALGYVQVQFHRALSSGAETDDLFLQALPSLRGALYPFEVVQPRNLLRGHASPFAGKHAFPAVCAKGPFNSAIVIAPKHVTCLFLQRL